MTILLTGIDGYIGWPTALGLARRFPDRRIVGIDNGARRRWVAEVGADTVVPISAPEERMRAAREHGLENLSWVEGDMTDASFVRRLVRVHRPEAVAHLAAQPSAPYSQIGLEAANLTQFNNNQSTRNLLWSLHEEGLAEGCRFVITTTTGVYGAPAFEIPEGFLEVTRPGGTDVLPFPAMAGSWYHMSRCNDVNNCWLANRQWGLSIADLRTAIVFGASGGGPEGDDPRLATRLDCDFHFGVVIHRFCAMAVVGHPLTLYGRGEQGKPFVSLVDCVDSIVAALGLEPDAKFRVFNQTLGARPIVRIAEAIQAAGLALGFEVDVEHIPNPRKEDEGHRMRIANGEFRGLLGRRALVDIEDGIRDLIEALYPHRDAVAALWDTFLPPDLSRAVRTVSG